MIILGIHDGHCASACLMVDGRLQALAAEERFSRKKNDHGYPRRAIDFCLSQVGLKASDIDEVAFASEHMHVFSVGLKALANFDCEDWFSIQNNYWKPKIFEGIDRPEFLSQLWVERYDAEEHFYDFSPVGKNAERLFDKTLSHSIRLDGLKRHLNISVDTVRFYDHHSCHAYYAYYGSHIRADNTIIYTLDGGGDSVTSTVFQVQDGRPNELARSNKVDVARIYREVTQLMGMKLGEHEFKVMGLAPYATDREMTKSWKFFDGMFETRQNMISYVEGRQPKDLHFAMHDAFKGHRFDGIAAAVQRMCETTVLDWVNTVQAKYKSKNAVFAGGVAMNVKLNMLISELEVLEDFYVCPSPTDDTLCVGACYMAESRISNEASENLYPVDDPYMGPAYDPKSLPTDIVSTRVAEVADVVEDSSPEFIAQLLASGKVISRCVGRMEFGQRALGNRSILADPRSDAAVQRINKQIKYRDFWMPFAPVMLAERAEEYIYTKNKLIQRPYMMIGAKTTEQGSLEFPAAIHAADKTARPQVLERSHNPDYYDLIKCFESITGTGGLLNTSFNLHGEPIVCSPKDAISTFKRSALDVLVLDGITLVRR